MLFLLIFLSIINCQAFAETPKNDIADRLIECYNKKGSWPILHYAIENERPDVAAEALSLFRYEATMHTPDIALLDSRRNEASQEYYYQIGVESGISALELAVRKGYLELAQRLLELGCKAGEVRAEYLSPIYFGTEDTKKYISAHQMSTNYLKRSVLYWAIESQNEEMVKLLLQKKPPLFGIRALKEDDSLDKTTFDIERTCTHLAASLESDEILRLLISYQKYKTLEGDLDEKIFEAFRTYVNNESNWPPLHLALKAGDHEAFRLLIEHGEDMNWQGRAAESLLTMAIACEDTYFLDLMISSGFSICDAIKEATIQNYVNHVSNLLPFLFPSCTEAEKLLETAIQKGRTEIAIQFLNHGIKSRHAIDWAVKANNLDLTRYLIELGDPNFPKLKGLDTAIRQGSVNMVELLTQAHIQKDRDHEDTLLSLAINSRNQKIFILVAEAGYHDNGMWSAFVDANEIEMLHYYLQHIKNDLSALNSMKMHALLKGIHEMLTYLMTL